MDQQARLDVMRELQRLAKDHKATTAWIVRLNRKLDIIKQKELELIAKLIVIHNSDQSLKDGQYGTVREMAQRLGVQMPGAPPAIFMGTPDNGVTHGCFFGENIQRVTKILLE
jgi:uncharacterized tellurite resistance protein B-like protein